MKPKKSQEEKLDLILYVLYLQTKGGRMYVLSKSAAINAIVKKSEFNQMKDVLYEKKLVELKNATHGFKGKITEAGIAFVETDSFTKPGTSILEAYGAV